MSDSGFSELLRFWMRDAGQTAEEAAVVFGVTPRTITRWLAGAAPRREAAKAVASTFGKWLARLMMRASETPGYLEQSGAGLYRSVVELCERELTRALVSGSDTGPRPLTQLASEITMPPMVVATIRQLSERLNREPKHSIHHMATADQAKALSVVAKSLDMKIGETFRVALTLGLRAMAKAAEDPPP